MIENSLCSMVARPSVIFGDGTKNFLDDDLLAGTLRSNREVDIIVLRMARQKFFARSVWGSVLSVSASCSTVNKHVHLWDFNH
jgi:hypothetical protein